MGKSWKTKLPDALWAYRTAYKTPLAMSPYQLVYGKTRHLPVELEHRAHWAIRKFNMDFKKAGMLSVGYFNDANKSGSARIPL